MFILSLRCHLFPAALAIDRQPAHVSVVHSYRWRHWVTLDNLQLNAACIYIINGAPFVSFVYSCVRACIAACPLCDRYCLTAECPRTCALTGCGDGDRNGICLQAG